MITTRIDRYVSRTFLVRFLGALVIIFGLYLTFDAVRRVDQIQRAGVRQAVPKILAYYGYLVPTRVLDIVPPLLLMGAGLTLVGMARRGELLTLKASGVSLRRVALPIFLWTLPVVLVTSWTRERFGPACSKQQELIERELDEDVVRALLLEDPEHHFILRVGRYNFATRAMSQVSVFERHVVNGVKRIRSVTQADSGTWLSDGCIGLEKVTMQRFDETGAADGKPEVRATRKLPTSLGPFDFVRAKEEGMVAAFTLSDLRRHMKNNPGNPRFQVMFHSRLAAPFLPFILLLIGIPLLIGFERPATSHVPAIVICILVATGFYVMNFVLMSMGNTGAIRPFLAGWLPVLLGGPIGIWMFGTMRT